NGNAPLPAASFARELDEERRRAAESHAAWRASAPRLRARWDDLVHTWSCSVADIASLRMHVGPADVGRELAASTLRVLAATQATDDDPERDSEPGKIIHEMRRGKAALAWTDRYYGSVDGTALFLILLSELWRWTDDPALPLELEDSARRALAWIDGPADPDGDGFVEYNRRSSN